MLRAEGIGRQVLEPAHEPLGVLFIELPGQVRAPREFSDALGVGLPVLVDVEQPRALTVTAAGQAPVLWRGPHGGQALLVAGTEPPDVVELWEWTLQPGEAHTSEAHSAGTRELLLVLEGRVDLRVGDRTERLGPGDSAAFAGDVAHGYATPADAATPARFALTVFQPQVGAGRK